MNADPCPTPAARPPHRHRQRRTAVALAAAAAALLAAGLHADVDGYYRFPALGAGADTVVFTAEGDLWRAPLAGGPAHRLTSHLAEETDAVVAPDGSLVAFIGAYSGSAEAYVMPLAGGAPRRLTWGGDRVRTVGWTPDGAVLVASRHRAGLPNVQLFAIDPQTGIETPIPLSEAAEGAYGPNGAFVFTRHAFQGSHTKRYRGGTARNLWRFDDGAAEAVRITTDADGECFAPTWWNDRIYLLSDRDGTMNVWSIAGNGAIDWRQHTRYAGLAVNELAGDGTGRFVYRRGADLYRLDGSTNRSERIDITLLSDLDQTRERWITEPFKELAGALPSPDGDRVLLTARGALFTAPKGPGRLVPLAVGPETRHREAVWLDADTIATLSDATGEVELATLSAAGPGPLTNLTRDGRILRFGLTAAPDGSSIVFQDKDRVLWRYDRTTGVTNLIARSAVDGDYEDLAFSPDARWLAWASYALNGLRRIELHEIATGRTIPVTSDRTSSFAPAWSPDGRWLYFLSNRHFDSIASSPWGERQPEPYLYNPTEVFAVALTDERRPPFAPADELHPPDPDDPPKPNDAPEADADASDTPAAPLVLTVDDLPLRAVQVPLPAGRYEKLRATKTHLYMLAAPLEPGGADRGLLAFSIEPVTKNTPRKPITVAEKVRDYELTTDGKHLLLRTSAAVLFAGADGKPADLDAGAVDLSDWKLAVRPRDEWRQMFADAWRLQRDYFYDPGMHGVDWPAMRTRYEPFVDRVTSREELADLLAQMVAELSALHTFVYQSDVRKATTPIGLGFLGADFVSVPDGLRIERIHIDDPDDPERRSPLARPDLDLRAGDVVTHINGRSAAGLPDPGPALQDQAGRQVRLAVRSANGTTRDVIVTPLDAARSRDLRYHDWEERNRRRVVAAGDDLAYVHLRAMGEADLHAFVRAFYPAVRKSGLIVDVRGNRGGNVDSWILSRLMRQAWMYWQGRMGAPIWNMQHAFRGHLIVLCDAWTMSDGEAFCAGVRRLGLAEVIGVRTWGGEIWLSSSNRLVDNGIATAAEYGVYGNERTWLIEGHGFEPDIVVDNPPHATFGGADAQLDAAIGYLRDRINADPRPVPAPPAYPDKSGP